MVFVPSYDTQHTSLSGDAPFAAPRADFRHNKNRQKISHTKSEQPLETLNFWRFGFTDRFLLRSMIMQQSLSYGNYSDRDIINISAVYDLFHTAR
jgi:hypothetical protein